MDWRNRRGNADDTSELSVPEGMFVVRQYPTFEGWTTDASWCGRFVNHRLALLPAPFVRCSLIRTDVWLLHETRSVVAGYNPYLFKLHTRCRN